MARKVKEALLALKIERTYSKEKILELYLNEIYLGLGAYGIAAASLVYFDKAVNELTVPEAAYLASLPKAPEQLSPLPAARARDRAAQLGDRSYGRSGFVKTADAEKAKRPPLGVTSKSTSGHVFAAEYFAEEVRRELYERYGEKSCTRAAFPSEPRSTPNCRCLARKTFTRRLGALR